MRTCGYVAAMILIQLNNGAAAILIKANLQRGLNQLVFMVYRHLIGFLLLARFAYVLERERRPPLTFSVAAWIFMFAFLSSTIRFNAYFAGLASTSPTVASALNNIVPSLTFLLAVLFRYFEIQSTKSLQKHSYSYRGYFEISPKVAAGNLKCIISLLAGKILTSARVILIPQNGES